jgi:hypothetical protein
MSRLRSAFHEDRNSFLVQGERKVFFFEKKKQKPFDCFGCELSGYSEPRLGSFFQKRTAPFL